jgi:hypothetical protein
VQYKQEQQVLVEEQQVQHKQALQVVLVQHK